MHLVTLAFIFTFLTNFLATDEEHNTKFSRSSNTNFFFFIYLFLISEFMSIMIGKYTQYVQLCGGVPWVRTKRSYNETSEFSP